MSTNEWSQLLTPQSLKNYGALENEVPTDEFNPHGDWELTWKVWLLKRGKKDTNHRGYIHLKKENISDESFKLYVDQKLLQVPHCAGYETNAVINCSKDINKAEYSWQLERKFFNHILNKDFDDISEAKSGTTEAGKVKITMSEQEISFEAKDNVTSNWSLMELIMRCGEDIAKHKFTILDELDKVKGGHVIKYSGEEVIPFGSKMINVKRYDQTGEGFLPWTYYIDNCGRLILAINGLRAYILDTTAQNTHKEISNNLTKKEGKSNYSLEKGVRDEGKEYEKIVNRPNILFITTDQQSLDTLSAYGNKYVNTPNMDRLVNNGVSFMKNYSTNPVCSPARSSLFTGRTSCETGVIANVDEIGGIREDIPNIGQWLSPHGYETVYSGKWHVPEPNPEHIEGFTVLPGGLGGQGTLGDQAVSSASAGWILNRKSDNPFFLTVNFLQPHDICNWISRHKDINDFMHSISEEELPPLPDNFQYGLEPRLVKPYHKMEGIWSDNLWRYYIWSYYRMVEEVDAEIGRILNALDVAGYTDNTVIIFTSDHGDGQAHHKTVTKNFLYDEAVRVPLIIAGPTTLIGKIDNENLTSGLDIMQTVCDFAGIIAPENCKGISLKPICEGKKSSERAFVVAEVNKDMGRMIRTKDFKLIAYRNDPVIQLFDMKNDPGETTNLADDPRYFDVLNEHRTLLNEWEASLDRAPSALEQFIL